MVYPSDRTLLHPLLPKPGDLAAYASDPLFLNICTLENDACEAGIIDYMNAGEDGQVTIETTWTQSRGSSARDGVNTQNIQATYTYRRVKR